MVHDYSGRILGPNSGKDGRMKLVSCYSDSGAIAGIGSGNLFMVNCFTSGFDLIPRFNSAYYNSKDSVVTESCYTTGTDAAPSSYFSNILANDGSLTTHVTSSHHVTVNYEVEEGGKIPAGQLSDIILTLSLIHI